MKVLVCGGREYANQPMVDKILSSIHVKEGIDLIINGACDGADHLASKWARARGIDYCLWPANFDYFGKSGGPRRNKSMLRWMVPDLVVAFPGGPGTKSMIDLAKGVGANVMVVDQ